MFAEETRNDDELDGNGSRGVAMEDRNGANEVAIEDLLLEELGDGERLVV